MPPPPSRQSLWPAQPSQQLPQTSQLMNASTSMSANKARQYAHLHSQLAQLNAHLADTENLVRMTAVQSSDIRFLGGYVGAMLMGSAKILGEESMKGKGEEEAEHASVAQRSNVA